jgi:hypothetical protein
VFTVVIVGLFGAFYAFPALWVRHSISIAYRMVFLALFTVGLFWFEATKYIAVLEQDSGAFTFVRRFPFGQTTVAASDLRSISTRKTKSVAELIVEAAGPGTHSSQTLKCQRVWLKDRAAIQVMDELALELIKARDAKN